MKGGLETKICIIKKKHIKEGLYRIKRTKRNKTTEIHQMQVGGFCQIPNMVTRKHRQVKKKTKISKRSDNGVDKCI